MNGKKLRFNMLEDLELITLDIHVNGYNDQTYVTLDDVIKRLAKTMNLKDQEQVIFLAFIVEAGDNGIAPNKLVELLGMTTFAVIKNKRKIDELIYRGFIFSDTGDGWTSRKVYTCTNAFLKALENNVSFSGKQLENLRIKDFMLELDECMVNDFDVARKAVLNLAKVNRQLELVQAIAALDLHPDDEYILYRFIDVVYINKVNLITEMAISNVYDFPDLGHELEDRIYSGKHVLQSLGLLKLGSTLDGVAEHSLVFTQKGLKLVELTGVKLQTRQTPANERAFADIPERELYFNQEMQVQVDTLMRLFNQEEFSRIQERMRERNMHTGVCCLLSGEPGTGKTELAMQLCRKTERNLIKVDVTDIMDKYVGESEKNVKAVFKKYEDMVAYCKSQEVHVPVLLLNECDQILSVRRHVNTSVDQMQNSLQNLILEFMEETQGIIICTSNLMNNDLDPAYERRFLYKIHFTNGDAQQRFRVLKYMLRTEQVDDETVERIANEFPYSPGQFENISRKAITSMILSGEEISYDMLRDICEHERIRKVVKHRKIGFTA